MGDALTRIGPNAIDTRSAPCLHHLFESIVEQRPDQVAIELRDKKLTYRELDAWANRIAWSLRLRGVKAGSLVGLYHQKSCDLFAAMLGILKAGAGYVPVDPKFPVDRIQHIFTDANVRAVVTSGELADGLSGLATEFLLLDRHADEIALRPVWVPPEVVDEGHEHDLAYVIYTSGSTGRPKGVMIEHRNAVTFVKSLPGVYGLNANDRIYQGFSTAFDASIEEIWAAFSLGGTLCVAPEDIARSPGDVAEFITTNRISFFSTVPTFLSMVEDELPTVRLLVVGGEACTAELVTRWATDNRRMLNTYGPTEATVVATAVECKPGQLVTIGKALPGYQTYVLDDKLNKVADGEPGELVIGGDGIARGYLNRPELTAEKFVVNPFAEDLATSPRLYRTQDLVRRTEDGSLQFLGRIDDQIKIRGFRVELTEIESVLLEHDAIRAAAVRVVQSGTIPELAAYVVADKATKFDRASVAEALCARLPEYMVPKYLDLVDEMPFTTSGKVDRKRLPNPVNILRRREGVVELPATDLERTIHAAWSSRFPGTAISVTDDFFVDLGGHSMLAAQVVTELRSKHNLPRASVRDLYSMRTIREFARHLAASDPGEVRDASTDPRTPSQRAFESVPAHERWTTIAVQTLSIMIYEGILIAPVAIFVWLSMSYAAGTIDLSSVLWWGSLVGFATWPLMLFISIAVKWLVIGRIKEGEYPVWSYYYCRWWVANLFRGLSWSHMFEGSPLMPLYFRAMGARVGRNAAISTSICSTYDLISIGDDTSIGPETHISGYRVEDGLLKLGRIDIENDCFVGIHCSLGLGTRMAAGSSLDDLTHLDDGAVLPKGVGLRGAPADPAVVTVPEADQTHRRKRPVLYGVLHLLLIYVMGYFLILAALPAIALGAFALMSESALMCVLAVSVAVPLSIVWYAALLVIVKKLFIGTIKPGRFPLHSGRYLRVWFLRYLLANTRQILMPVYATIFLPTLYRLLGAKIGAHAELSTVNQVIPDLMDIGESSFLGDECIIGGIRIHHGVAEIKQTKIGRRTFIGNSAFIRGGVTLGDESLLGVMSTPPINTDNVPSNTQWLGVPGFALPRPKAEVAFDEARTFSPSKRLTRTRAVIDAVRILLPGYMSAWSLGLIVAISSLSFSLVHWWIAALALPLLVNLVAFAAVLIVALLKRLIIGTFTPSIHPLWSPFVWLNDVVNGVFETIAANAMAPFMGTPYVAPLLRLMGCKVGKWCYIETTFFSEYDLVRIGDYAALNLGSTLQTHLFEDRVMKSDILTVGEGCSVGNMAIVLYSTEMERGSSLGPLSVLIKGETLPTMSRWGGIPSLPRSRLRSIDWSPATTNLNEPLDASATQAAAQ